MRRIFLFLIGWCLVLSVTLSAQESDTHAQIVFPLTHEPQGNQHRDATLRLFDLSYETSTGKVFLPAVLTQKWQAEGRFYASVHTADQRTITLTSEQNENGYSLHFSANPSSGILRWNLSTDCSSDEYITGVMERLVDGPQQETWAPGRTEALNLHGQSIDMLLKPTLSVYAPFYISSRGYGLFVKGTWPGHFDFCAKNADKVAIAFEGPSLEFNIYTGKDPAALVRAHAMDAGPPVLPPKWMYSPWRWRDEHTERATYYDGTPVTGPFNSEFMEDVLLMKAYGIPNGVYWIDRPWGPGPQGYDDFEIDAHRLPHFKESIEWLNQQGSHMLMWIGPYFQGHMADEALAKHYNMPDQVVTHANYPLADFTNPAAKKFWQDGVAKLLKLGVVGFKMDRSEEDIPDDGPDEMFNGHSIRENRNAYPIEYLQAADEVARHYHSDGDYVLMPRAAYTGSSRYGVFWGGDIGGTQAGLRAEIIAVQRAAVMGYPNWGSDTCGYNQQLLEEETCARWLQFSAFTPIMEVGPTKNVAFWDLPRSPSYDETLIAVWRLYARLHERISEYSYKCAQEAQATGMPIVRPLFLVDPAAKDSWQNWWTYLYGPDLLISHIWQIGQHDVEVYLPSGAKWRDAWNPEKVYDGGQRITAHTEMYQMPLYVRAGSGLDLGDLNREWSESVAAAHNRPDIKALDAAVKDWFNQQATRSEK